MTSFDYLGKRWNLRGILHRFRPKRGANASVNALICSCIVVGASWAIEAGRLRESVEVERGYGQRYETQMRMLAQANLYSRSVQSLVQLDGRIRSIASSGTSTAQRLAAIAGDLPGNIWLTSVAPDGVGIAVEGRAPSLSALSLALRRLSNDRSIGDPALVSAQAEDGAVPDLAIRFALHFSDRSPANATASP